MSGAEALIRLAPKKVYLHAGTRQGARNLGLECGAGVIEVDALPAPLCGLKPFEAEDVLCIYKAELLRIAVPGVMLGFDYSQPSLRGGVT